MTPVNPEILDALGLPRGATLDEALRAIDLLKGDASPPAAMARHGLTKEQLQICRETGCPPERFAALKHGASMVGDESGDADAIRYSASLPAAPLPAGRRYVRGALTSF